MTTTPSLIDEARDAERRAAERRRRVRGADEYERALAPQGEVCRARIARRRAMMADGLSVAALQAALLEFADDPGYARSPRATGLRREAAGVIQQALELLTEVRCAQDEERVARTVQWADNDWSLPEWIRVQIADLDAFVPEAPDVAGLLDPMPWWREQIRLALRNDRASSGAGVLIAPPERQTYAVRAAPEDE